MELKNMAAPFATSGTLFKLVRCRGCHNAVIDPAAVEKSMLHTLAQMDFEKRLAMRLNKPHPLHHELMHLAVAGCPNGCTQPQIKDFAVVGQMVVEPGDGCTACGACVAACPDGCVSLDKSGPLFDRDRCLNCGLCLKACPTGTLRAVRTGYRILAGGRLGRRPCLGATLEEVASLEQVAAHLARRAELFVARGRLADGPVGPSGPEA